MKLHNKTLLELRFKNDLSMVGACAACYAAKFQETTEYARQDVAKHRAISREIREEISVLLKNLDWQDARVERDFQTMRRTFK